MLTHASVGCIVGGAVVGGVAGHVLTPQKKHYSYADTHRRYRKHAEPRRDYDADYDRDGNYIDRR